MARIKLRCLIGNNSSLVKIPLSPREIKECISAAIVSGGLNSGKYEVSIYFVDDREMRDLNIKYRGVNRTTDVLSFPQYYNIDELGSDPARVKLLGDIVISIETLKRRAIARGDDLAMELKRLLIHGTLHLLGYDHVKRPGREVMRKLEEELIDRG